MFRMKRTIYILVFTVVAAISCRPDNIISKDDLADIFYDFYMADRYVESTDQHDLGDSVSIYIPILKKHGYTFDQYQATIDYYLHKPEELTKTFKLAESMLKERKEALDIYIAKEAKKHRRWKLLDSLELYGDQTVKGNGYYRALRLLFFKSDTMEVTSPTIDSIILNHITLPYFLYDSLPGMYDDVTFIVTSAEPSDSLTDNGFNKPVPKSLEEMEQTEDEDEERANKRLKNFNKAVFNDKKEDFR